MKLFKIHVYVPAIMTVVELMAEDESTALDEALRIVGSQSGKGQEYYYQSEKWIDPDCVRIARVPENESVNSAFQMRESVIKKKE